MKSAKKNALSYDNTASLVKTTNLLLQKNGNQFFLSNHRALHPIISTPTRKINVSYKFGLSKDSPFHSKYSFTNELTPSIFKDHPCKKYKLFRRMLSSTAEKHSLVQDSFSKNSITELCSNLASPRAGFAQKLILYKRSHKMSEVSLRRGSSNTDTHMIPINNFSYHKQTAATPFHKIRVRKPSNY